MVFWAVILALTLVSAIIAAYAQFLFKSHVHEFDFKISHIIGILKKRGVYSGLALYALAFLIYLYALGMGALSFVYPIFSSTFIFVMIIARFKLKEPITRGRGIAIALTAIGIFLVVLG